MKQRTERGAPRSFDRKPYTQAMAEAYMCQTCGDRFEVSVATRAKFPGWTPRQCMPCREKAPIKSASSRGGFGRRAAAKPTGGDSATREENLPVAEILARYTAGPTSGVFTDGSCAGNPGPGGWGVVHVKNGEVLKQLHGADPDTTNNRMELTAMISGLELLAAGDNAEVYTDSQLVVNTLTKWAAGWEKLGWKRKEGEVKNLELVQRAYFLTLDRPGVKIKWIRAHDGSRWNEYADSLSTAYMRETV